MSEINIKGRVRQLFYSGPRFSAGKLDAENGEVVSFAGAFYTRENEALVLCGQWKVHPKYGRQFAVNRVVYDMDLDAEGLAHYLANNPDIKGIGPAKTKLIADTFGKDFEKALNELPEKVAATAKVPLAVIEALRERWELTRETNKAMTWLSAFGLTHHQVSSLVKKFGNSVMSVLKEDPYIICREIRGFGFKKVDLIARKMGSLKESESRIRAGILHCVSETLDQGDCWTELEELIDRANLLLVMDVLDSRERIEKVLDDLIQQGMLSCISNGGRFLVARPDIHRMESELAKTFLEAKGGNPHFSGISDLPKWIRKQAPSLNDGQLRAVELAFSHRLALISGGAGSGKTFTISAIAKICRDRDLEVILAAPTGKAAKRMEELADGEAYTLHRLLKYDGSQFGVGPDNPIDADVLIVDEVSMVDVSLAWQLFQAVDPERTSVVLVGDHNQLPPVGPGNILRDLIQSESVPKVVLDRVVRQAGVLKENCTAVLSGDVRANSDVEANGRRAWYRLNQYADPLNARKFLLEMFSGILNEKLGYDLNRDVQVLSPTHKGPLGTRALNEELQVLLQQKLWGAIVDRPKPGRRPKLLARDKIIQTRNNYKLGVMNGAIGSVLCVERDGSMLIDFDGQVVEIEKGSPNLNDLQLAYCQSVHKAQGSEFPCVICIVHKSHSFMHHRNLFYTAVTRARETVIVLGDRWGIRNCAEQKLVDRRKTFLSFMLPSKALF